MKHLVETLLLKNVKEIRRHTQMLCEIGETSGADTAVGLLLGLKMREKW